MNCIWFSDLEKAIKVLRYAVPFFTFGDIRKNPHNDFIFSIDGVMSYLVKCDDFSVWQIPKDGNERWQIVSGPYDEDEIAEENAARESLGENWY